MENFHCVFKTFESAHSVLLDGLKEDERLSRFYEYFVDAKLMNLQDNSSRRFVVVIEGLDGTGKVWVRRNACNFTHDKTTLVSGLSKKLGWDFGSIFLFNSLGYHAKKTPPLSVNEIRPYFDDKMTDQRMTRAFYSVCNYLCANEILRYVYSYSFSQFFLLLRYYYSSTLFVWVLYEYFSLNFGRESHSCIIDRFYASTLCYALPDQSLAEFQFGWPGINYESIIIVTLTILEDLLIPNLVIYLDLPEEVRKKR
jgi:hypothetical protein